MNEIKLIKKIKNKDQKALLEFIDIYGPILKGAISQTLSLHKELIGEVLDDSMLAIWDNIDSFDPSRSSFKNWCAGIAKYKAIDALRKEIRHQSINLDSLGEVPSDDEITIDESFEILRFLNDDDKILFKKLFLEGYSYEDISKETGLSKNILYNRVSRAKKLIRFNLKEQSNEKCL